MNINLTRKQFWIVSFILGILMFIVSMTVNMIGLYYDDEIKIGCSNGSVKIYNKTDLNKLDKLCDDDINIYKYNNNSGLGAYFPDKRQVNRAITEFDNKPVSINFKYNQSIITGE